MANQYAPKHFIIDGAGEHECPGSRQPLFGGTCTGCGLTPAEIKERETGEEEALREFVVVETLNSFLSPEHRN